MAHIRHAIWHKQAARVALRAHQYMLDRHVSSGPRRNGWDRNDKVVLEKPSIVFFGISRFTISRASHRSEAPEPPCLESRFCKTYNYEISICRAHPCQPRMHRVVQNSPAHLGKQQISDFTCQRFWRGERGASPIGRQSHSNSSNNNNTKSYNNTDRCNSNSQTKNNPNHHDY